jgi:serine/threonine protein kinase/sugar lactone lactonase YvrE
VRQLAEALQLSTNDRAIFEQAALAPSAASPIDETLPEGSFLGALPTNRLVGREEELERVRAVLDSLVEGVGHLLLLAGEMGAGKTRLLQEIMLEGHARACVVLTGRCYPSEQGTSYYPFLESLARLTPSVPASLRMDVQRGWKRVQHLADGSSAGNGAVDHGGVGQPELFGAVSDLLLLVAHSVPVVLLLDDLHWADSHSLKLLQHLAHATRSSRILLTAAFRDVRLTEEHPNLAQTLQTLIRERLAERITVRRLSLEETTRLVAVTMGQQEVSEEFASFVYRRTKGSPRLIDQLVRSLGGRLELQGEIGAGSMGRVFRAFDRTTDQTVAAKLVLARAEIDLDTLLRFQQEGAVLAKLEHPHIVDVYDTFAEEHATCIIMELLDGQSLGHMLRAGPLSLAQAKHLALQVAEALSYAHSQSIVHRDVKPDNVLVLPDDRVKVTDFGIARLLQPDTSLQTMATTGMRMGTPLYMAPEQIEGKKIDGRTDIYGLGAMLYHMVTGRPPFEGSDALTIAVRHLQEEPLPPSEIDPAIPSDWDGVILKAMAKNPVQRFQRAAEMKEAIAALPAERGGALSSLLGRHDEIVRGAQSAADVASEARPSRTPSRVKSMAVASAALIGVAAALWLSLVPPWSSARSRGFTGNPIAVWGVKIPSSFHFKDPIILGSPVKGSLYVGDPIHIGIVRLSARTGKLLAAWGSKGQGPGQLRDINDIALDSHGNVYTVDDTNNRITEFSVNGRFLRTVGHTGFNPGELYGPTALTFDSKGNILVTDAYNDRIQKLSPTGKTLAVWGSRGNAPGKVYGPNAIRLDAHGNVWVSEHVNRRIQEFSPTGKSLVIIGGPGEFTALPGSLAFDRAGNVYVVEFKRMQKFSPSGRLLAVWAVGGKHPEFKVLGNISIDNQDHVYLADPGNGRLHILSPTGKLLADWNVHALVRQLFQLPTCVALDLRGNAYVSDSDRNVIEKISPAGDLLLHWGRTGSGLGELRHPAGIALDSEGHVYVADTGNGRIQEFSPSGTAMSEWYTGIARGSGQGHPTGLAIDRRGNVYVTDPARNLVQEFSPAHKLRLQWGRTDRTHSLYWLESPTGIAVDGHGNVYVADSGHFRVVEFAPSAAYFGTGRPLRSWGGTRGYGPGQFSSPSGVAVDARGNVYVIDAGAAQVQVFTARGKLIANWGRHGTDPGNFQEPTGIALDAAGNVYVADSGNSRIQKFRLVS